MVERLPSGLYQCRSCIAEYASAIAAIACEDSHEDDERRWRHHDDTD